MKREIDCSAKARRWHLYIPKPCYSSRLQSTVMLGLERSSSTGCVLTPEMWLPLSANRPAFTSTVMVRETRFLCGSFARLTLLITDTYHRLTPCRVLPRVSPVVCNAFGR
ncbi:hypothetical protein TNCV_947201 [Trichonephila clavipes]|nr:hypothetical protein TNCV_947201 [Trichonephila clavipes]